MWKYLPFKILDAIVGVTKLLTGATGVWSASTTKSAEAKQRIYFANHTSNLDTIVIWSCLPPHLRETTRAVAAKDYWGVEGSLKHHIAVNELNVVFVERDKTLRGESDALEPLRAALRQGESLIVFPEGQRNKETVPGAFKSGIFRLHEEFPGVELIPIYLENVAKTFPRGAPVPIPVICRVHFGAPFVCEGVGNPYVESKEARAHFLKSARLSVIDLIPEHQRQAAENFEEQVKNPPVRQD